MKKILLLLVLICILNPLFGNVDSLKKVLENKSISPEERVSTLKDLSFQYCFINPDSGMMYAHEIYKLAKKHNNDFFKARGDVLVAANYYLQVQYDSAIFYYKKAIEYGEKDDNYKILSSAYNNLGLVYMDRSEYQLSLEYLHKGLDVRKKKKDKEEICESYNNIGLVYQGVSDFTKAIEYQFKALKTAEELNSPNHISDCYNNIAISFDMNGDHKKSLVYYFKALKLIEKSGSHYALASSYANIAVGFNMLNMTKSAMKYIRKSVKHSLAFADYQAIYVTYNNIGLIFLNDKDSLRAEMGITKEQMLDSALLYFNKSLEAPNADYNFKSFSNVYLNISSLYLQKKMHREAKASALKSLELAKKAGAGHMQVRALWELAEISKELNQFNDAYFFLNEYLTVKEEVFSIEKNNEMTKRELNHDFAKKQLEDSITRVKEKQIAKDRIDQQNAIIEEKEFRMYLLYAGIGIVLVFSYFLYNRIRLINSQKKTIENQKHLVDEKQKEIIDSINYAQRLQRAILAPKTEIDKYFNHNFLYYKPKDIVAGDFYFFETKDNYVFYAAADCTGHGVPGAMVSIVCANALTRCVKEFDMTDPGKILDKTRDLILETFQKSGEDVKDGMDISLCVFKVQSSKFNKEGDTNIKPLTLTSSRPKEVNFEQITWAGANNPLWYIVNGEMKEIKADKQPIGKSDHRKSFTTHTLPLSLSALFLFTDGYADQFGGPKGKKFKYANLQKLLLEDANEQPEIIYDKLDSTFMKYRGELEQVDDVCIIGVKF